MHAIYLDNAATTPLDPGVRAAMQPFFDEEFGNPSSRHRLGQRAADAIDAARGAIALAVGARSEHVVFTSGGTEANNLGVLGAARARAKRGKHVLYGPTEHASVREAAEALRVEGFEVERLRLDCDGALDLEHLASRLRADTVLVAQMLVQNEFGTIYPVRAVSQLVRARAPHAFVHVDAVQALGKLELSIGSLGADSLALSAHKVHGPKGAGALVLASDLALRPMTFGGGQEYGLRAGTENVAAIAGFGAAAKIAEKERAPASAMMEKTRAAFVAGLARFQDVRVLEPGRTVHGSVPSIVSVQWPGAPAEVRMHHLDEQGVVASAGSACQSRRKETSPALLALGLRPEEARTVLRFSFSRFTTIADVERALDALETVHESLESARR